MNILHINTNYLNNALHQNMIESLGKKDILSTVFVPTYEGSQRVIKPNDNVIISNCFNKWDRVNFYSKQKKILKSVKMSCNVKEFDIIHAYTVFTDGNVAYNLHKEYGIPYVVAVRNTDINTFFKYMVHLRKRGIEILKNASAVFFLSSVYKKRLFIKYLNNADAKIIEPKCYIMPNGIDDFWLKNLFADKDFTKADDVIKLACVGAVDHNKNMLSVARALDLLKNKGNKVSLSIAGKIKDQNIYECLMKFDFVKYMGVLPKEKLIDVYRANDVFALTSFNESFGMVYIEAMSQGLPVIYTKDEGFDGQFDYGTVGYSVLPDDVTDISDKIYKCYLNREKFNSVYTQTRRFSWSIISEKYKSVYDSVKV